MADSAEENEPDDAESDKKENGLLEEENELVEKDENAMIDIHSSQDQNVDVAITNATKNLLSSICTVFSLLYDEKYKFDYHVSLEKIMQIKKFEHKERGVSQIIYIAFY